MRTVTITCDVCSKDMSDEKQKRVILSALDMVEDVCSDCLPEAQAKHTEILLAKKEEFKSWCQGKKKLKKK